MSRKRHPNVDVSFLVCDECEALVYGLKPGPLPEDQLGMFLERQGVDWSISLVDADNASVQTAGIGHD
jgi:hypothetical protein